MSNTKELPIELPADVAETMEILGAEVGMTKDEYFSKFVAAYTVLYKEGIDFTPTLKEGKLMFLPKQ